MKISRLQLKAVLFVALGLLLSGLGPTAGRLQGKVETGPARVKKVLVNGLPVLVEENFGAPVVAIQVWANVGSADETEEEIGLSHCLEHMLFKSTKKRAEGELSREIESLGGYFNAYTNKDNTVYLVTLPSRYFEQGLDVLADMIQNPLFVADEWAREKEVILEEIRRSKDSPARRLYNYLNATVYQVHPYTRPVIGFTETVSKFTRDDLERYHRKWYVPTNLAVVVAGDVKAEHAIARVNHYFGSWKPSDKKIVNRGRRKVVEPAQSSLRAKVVSEEVTEVYLALAFQTPDFMSADMPALDVLSVVLSGGESSRLPYRLRAERKLVTSIDTFSNTPRDPGFFAVIGNLEPEKLPPALDMTLKQLYLLKHEPVEDWELEKAKLSIQTSAIFAREAVDGQADLLGSYYSLTGDLNYDKVYYAKIKAVTKKDLQRVAQKYFKADNLSVIAILPPQTQEATAGETLNEEGVKKIAAAVETWSQNYRPGALTEPEPITPPEIPQQEPTPSLTQNVKGASAPAMFKLKNGIRLIVRENHAVPLLKIIAIFPGGLRRETRENNGISNFTAQVLTEGTKSRSAAQIHSFMEARAGSISAGAGRDFFGVSMSMPAFYFRSALPVFAEVIREPTFPAEEVERKRPVILAGIKNKVDRPATYAFRLFLAELFKQHPYGLDLLGTEEVVKNLSAQDLKNYYQGFAGPENMIITVVGDITAEEARKLIAQNFEDWKAQTTPPPQVAVEPPPTAPRDITRCRNKLNQTTIVIGFQGPRYLVDDYYALEVLSSVLGGMSGRLFMNLREKQSLAYAVQPRSDQGLDPGFFAIYIGTAPEKEEKAIQGIWQELQKVREEPVTEDELKRAQQALIGDFEIGLQYYGFQAALYGLYEFYGQGYQTVMKYPAKINAVSQEQILAAAKKYLDPQRSVTAILRPCAGGEGK